MRGDRGTAGECRLESRHGKPEACSTSVAIVGMACRFPGAADLAAFRALLRECRDAISDPPTERREWLRLPEGASVTTMRGGYLAEVDRFDPEFFGISPREAAEMDPQQRLALEVSYEALADAGVEAAELRNRSAGVFLGISLTDYGRRLLDAERAAEISGYAGTSANTGAAAGRIAYWLGARGPCVAVDTACSSSLTAIHLAAQALRAGECELALAGGVQLNLFPEMLVFLSQARALAPDGRSKPFDAAADGYGRGEGCGMIALKRLEDAERDGDRVWAVIRGSAINHDGPSSGFTVPNGMAQRALLESALRDAGLRPEDVQFLEAHGTGTLLGDPIELDAAGEVYGAGRSAGALHVGSVKANIGHLEAAAGVAGTIKAALAVREGFLPGQPGFGEPNPRIPWSRYSMRVAERTTEWPEGPRRAAVSAFGLSGSNAHLVLEQAAWEGGRAALAPRPYKRRRFWMRDAAGLWDRKIESPLIGGTLFTAELRGERRRLLEDHRVRGAVVVPGAYYLTMAAAASGRALEEVGFPRALIGGTDASLHLLVERDRFRVASGDGTIHAEGTLAERGAAERIDVRSVLARCSRAFEDLYGQLARRQIGLGERFRRLEDARIGDGEAIARVRKAGPDGAPGLVDACFQLFSPLLRDAEGTAVPWRVGRCEIYDATLDRAAWVHAILPGEAEILDADGRVLARLTGIVLRGVADESRTRPFAYRVEWTPVETSAQSDGAVFASEGPTTSATLLALADLARDTGGRRLIVATRTDDPGAGLLEGFTRCLAVENPGLRPVLVEGDAEAAGNPSGSGWRRVRGGRVEKARLSRVDLGEARPLPVRADGTYLVTGGTGSLGQQIAKMLEEQGAGRVVVASRSTGCDVRDPEQVRVLITGLPELRGVVHAAGVRRDGMALDAAGIEDAIGAKVSGAWNLHEATRERPLDFFILVSSAAGTLGSPGQAAYGAANAALDALARERRRLGLPAVSVAWGPWQESAMVSGLTARQQQAWRDRGVTPLRAEDALRDLGAVAACGEAHVLYLDADWEKLARMWGDETPEFLEGLVARRAAVASPPTVSWGELPFDEARARMTTALREEVAAVLALDRPFAAGTPFFDLGMDSLTALELRNRLESRFGVALPATLMFDCPSLPPLTDWMLKQVGVSEEVSEEELERLLLAKIEELEAKGLR
jgi:acyl transferase domain-containing protein/acyl carrier protein